MSNVLVLNSSLSGAHSVSDEIVADIVGQLAQPGVTITRRDLARDPVPHLTHETVAGVTAEAVTPAEQATRALSDALIAELRAADVIVIGAPMYNFSIASTLRTWFDHVLRARVTFSYSATGPEGLLKGKRAIVVESRAGAYGEGPATAMDFQEPYVRHLLGFMGITDVTFVRAERVASGPEARVQAIRQAIVAGREFAVSITRARAA